MAPSTTVTEKTTNGVTKVEVTSNKSSGKVYSSSIAVTEAIEAPMTTVISKVALSGPDRLIFRLNKLFAPTKDLGSVLTTFNYALYILAYLDFKASGLKSKAFSLLSLFPSAIRPHDKSAAGAGESTGGLGPLSLKAHQPESSAFARLGAVVYNARATLRLFGLLPIYVRARQLVRDAKSMDRVLCAIGMLQCALYGTFQLLENAAFLTDNKVLPAGRNLRVARVARLYRIAHRAWFLGVMCDFVRLIREAQLFFWRVQVDQKGEVTEEQALKAAHWYYDWIKPLAWLPIGWQLSAWSENGLPGFNLGLQGVAGVLADLKRATTLWHATEDV